MGSYSGGTTRIILLLFEASYNPFKPCHSLCTACLFLPSVVDFNLCIQALCPPSLLVSAHTQSAHTIGDALTARAQDCSGAENSQNHTSVIGIVMSAVEWILSSWKAAEHADAAKLRIF